mgnify:CR=1 FL=1
MPKIKITELNSELMAEAIANAQARRNKLISELSEEQTAEVVGGRFKPWPPIIKPIIKPWPPIILGLLPWPPEIYK